MHRIAFVTYAGFQSITLAALTAFELVNRALGAPLYEVSILTEDGGTIDSSLPGLSIESSPLDERAFDTTIFAGGLDYRPTSPRLIDYVHHAMTHSRRVAAICTGAFVLADAGVLDGRRATTHWVSASDFRTRYPMVRLEPDRIFVIDGNVWTSAGATAGIDLALGMVEADLGEAMARQIAKKLVVYHRRGGGQSQHSSLLDLPAKSDRIQAVIDYARRNLHQPLNVEDLADEASLSPRQFSRAFRQETGQSPAKALERLRVEAARNMIEQTRHPIDVIATQTGFADRERMRRAFLRAYGQPPQAIKRLARRASARVDS